MRVFRQQIRRMDRRLFWLVCIYFSAAASMALAAARIDSPLPFSDTIIPNTQEDVDARVKRIQDDPLPTIKIELQDELEMARNNARYWENQGSSAAESPVLLSGFDRFKDDVNDVASKIKGVQQDL